MIAEGVDYFSCKVKLLHQADRLSKALCTFSIDNAPGLATSDDADILAYVSRHTAALEQLERLEAQLTSLDPYPLTQSQTEQCEQLRHSIRANLDAITEYDVLCRTVVEDKVEFYRKKLLQAQQKKNMTSYVRSSMIGLSTHKFDSKK